MKRWQIMPINFSRTDHFRFRASRRSMRNAGAAIRIDPKKAPLLQRLRNQSGQIFVLTAVALVALLGMAALAVDVGSQWAARRNMQIAADAAAVAGTRELSNNNSSNVTSAAKNDASLNGYTDGTGGVTVTVNNPPLSGTYVGDDAAVEVTIKASLPAYFEKVLNINSVQASTRAVAHLGGGPCVYVMDTSASKAFTATGSASLTTSCDLWVNSSNSTAMSISGNACVTANSIGVVGNYSNGSSCSVSPTPKTGLSAISDPLASYPAPTFGSCDHTNFTVNSGSPQISQGVYCNGITISGNAKPTFTGGLYILNGGGLSIQGGANASGNSVTFYNTGNGTYHYKPIVVRGGSTTTLSAPTSGVYQGMLFYEDRSITSNSQNTVSGEAGPSSTVFSIFSIARSSSQVGAGALAVTPRSWRTP